ncbi:MAG: hypothetical protein QNJ42_21295 [Crocosphaera sp.]|nr:hypothetical protein [Crocosphaera sp.]
MDNFKTILATITATMESLLSFVQMVAEAIREKNWVKLICLILAIVVVVGCSWGAIHKLLSEKASQVFILVCIVVGILFSLAVTIAVFNKPKLTSTAPLGEQIAIKGLRAFTKEDAEIFRELERNTDIKNCLLMLKDREFRIGILYGESGCGKSSFIQAGLIPELSKEESEYVGIYINCTVGNAQ